MTLDIRQSTPSDKEAWNRYVLSHPQATPYQNYGWVESVAQAYGHPNHSLIALEDGNVVGVLPVSQMQIPMKGKSLCSLPYCDLGYALSDSEQITDALISRLKQEQQKIGANKIEYRDTGPDQTEAQDLTGRKVRMLLPLPDTSDELLKGFKSKLRSQIRKAEKNGLTYEVGNSSQLLDAFYQVFIHNMRKLGSPVHSKAWFEAIQKNYGDNIFISIIYTEQTPIGGGIVLRNGDKACIPWASTLAEYNRLAPNMLLYWSLLATITDAGCKEFDFGRSTYDEGTYKFKSQWGALPTPLNWNLPGEQPQPEESDTAGPGTLRKLVEQTWPKLPLGVTTFVGPKVRKYISL